MYEHVTQTCGESNGLWLPIIEYSIKAGVSLSTIRRKIKSNSIPFRVEKGKYFLLWTGCEMATYVSQNMGPAVESSVKWANEALDQVVRVKDERIKTLERKNSDLEAQLNEMRLLVEVLEEKYEVRY